MSELLANDRIAVAVAVKVSMIYLLIRPVLVLIVGRIAFSQTPRAEIGVQLSGIRENALGEYPVGAGGRVTVHVIHFVDAEAEINRFPIGGGTALFPATQAIFGARVGQRFGPIGIYGKLRPGFMRFDANVRVQNLGVRPVLDFGGVLELYSRRRIAVRFDLGDTAVWYGRDTVIPPISSPGPSIILGTRHQLKWSFGFSFWF
jgi:hypothetical protein